MAQQPGTLIPGQSISVNKYTVQVERYLSQGGFAHVYLVRTATPVYNTTHHVLKRIAVANDTMLTEVKKEVDIMRLLKGHPNIVHLIDAAWHRMPNGLYEVFILMEFCPGGGIIDMMNRRLRERLTEAEILQIFVDVCEGVAYMHNSRPPLLHRDLKVENILQASATSFKLCDFGSATTVASRPPATMQEIRALEADLNRHTTLQYRAPEMVDPYMRRPVDEKSDIWALGVLLYKLCYYTTPFEEHGPLAILNVQYRIPPYPVYSTQMNTLIASMLREHGHQRPNVFELLTTVHRLRGTKSQFTYNVPAPQPLSPRTQTQFSPPPNPIDSTVMYRSHQPQVSPGVQARDKVLEAIAPMRRGRPTTETRDTASPSRSRPASPQKPREPANPTPPAEKAKNWLDEEEKAWKAATVHNGSSAPKRSALDEAWMTRGPAASNATPSKGFGDDFAEKLWDEFDPKSANTKAAPSDIPPALPARPGAAPAPLRQPVFTGSLAAARGGKDKDAFDGLGLSTNGDRPAPTLGEARLLRTGLAGMSGSTPKYGGDYKDYKSSRPLPTPQPSYVSQTLAPSPSLPTQSLSPNPPALKPSSSGSSWLSHPPSSMSRPGSGSGSGQADDNAETRFPSLEELDKTFGAPSGSPANGSSVHGASQSVPPLPPRKDSGSRSERHTPYGSDGVRSQQVTSTAMRDTGSGRIAQPIPTSASPASVTDGARPLLTRKHRSSLTMKHTYGSSDDSTLPSRAALGSTSSNAAPSSSSRDWLTGDDDDLISQTPSHTRTATTPAMSSRSQAPETASNIDYTTSPVMRESPSKRASFIEKSPLHIQEAVVPQREHVRQQVPPSPNTPSSPTARAQRVFPVIDLGSEPSELGWGSSSVVGRAVAQEKEADSASSADEGPEDANGYTGTPRLKSTHEVGRAKRKGRQSSVHDLVDLYGGAGSLALPPKDKERVSPGPVEDLTPRKNTFTSGPSAAQSKAPVETKAKRQSMILAAVSTAHPASSALSPPNSGKPPASPRSAGSASSTTSSKSRPQSMFVFPSKQTSILPPSTLSPSEDPKPRVQKRRTSISDMVQRYETFGGKPLVSPVAPPMTSQSKSLGATVAVAAAAAAAGGPRAENGRFPSMSSQGTSSSSSTGFNSRPSTGPATMALPSAGAGGPPQRVSPTGLPRVGISQENVASPRARRTSFTNTLGDPSKGVSMPPRVSPTGLPRTGTPQQESTVPPRTRGTSFKSPDMGGAASASALPSRKATADPGSGERSPSPERPYQGVGKLIDQWQRKTAESDGPGARGSGPVKRGAAGGFVAKRAGLVGKGG